MFDQVAFPARTAPTYIPDAYVAGTAAANQYTPGISRCGTAPAAVPVLSVAAEKAIGWMRARTGAAAVAFPARRFLGR
ncbi:MAG: hypothetical protein ACRDRU_29200 [Pseudonocardiaceae bacterium]